jgi:hypothetical protein
MADATYQPAVYRKQGGDELVIASSGLLTVESGGEIEMETGSSMTFASGSGLALASGSSLSIATALEVASGGSISLASGSSMTIASGAGISVAAGAQFGIPYEVVSSSDTTIAASGVSWITGTTAGPDYVLATPTYKGQYKILALNASSSGATHRATIYTGSTGRLISFSGAVTGNTLTLATSNSWNAELIAAGTSGWVCLRHGGVSEPILSNKST